MQERWMQETTEENKTLIQDERIHENGGPISNWE
jgi:hypothetical protein